jgi:hypothetical protein
MIRACVKNKPAAGLRRGRPAGFVAPRSQISLEYAPSSRLAIQPAALAIPLRAYFSHRLFARLSQNTKIPHCRMATLFLQTLSLRRFLSWRGYADARQRVPTRLAFLQLCIMTNEVMALLAKRRITMLRKLCRRRELQMPASKVTAMVHDRRGLDFAKI